MEPVQVQLLPPKSDTPPTCLMGDPDRLKGVLLNLYSNAAKFTRSGFICVRVRRCLANEVASETLLDPERSYRQCLEALAATRGRADTVSEGGGADGASMEAAANAVAAEAGGAPWWQNWLDNGVEPEWDSWRPCSLPPPSSAAGSGTLDRGQGDGAGGAISIHFQFGHCVCYWRPCTSCMYQ